MYVKNTTWLCCGLYLWLSAIASVAQARPGAEVSLAQAFEQAWQRQPEAVSLDARQQAALAQAEVASSWSADAPSLELSTEGDQLHGNDGVREHSLGINVPLWLPGERRQQRAVAQAQQQSLASEVLAAKLRTAEQVREVYWAWLRACAQVRHSLLQQGSAEQLVADVERRLNSGDVALADLHQAQSLLSTVQIELMQHQATQALSAQQWFSLTGVMPTADDQPIRAEAVPKVAEGQLHPQVQSLLDQAALARQQVALIQTQRRGNPELSLATTRSRSPSEPDDDTLTLAIRIPLGSASRHQARQSSAEALALEAESAAYLMRERFKGEQDLAQLQLRLVDQQVQASEQRWHLAQRTQGFFSKSFELGETDLPTRLRIEQDTAEAGRQYALAKIEQAAAISRMRQTFGLLPTDSSSQDEK